MFFSFSCLCPHLILDDHYCCCCYCLSEVRLCWHLHHHHPIADLVVASVDVHLSTRANKHHYILTHPCYLSSHNTSIQKSVRPSVHPSLKVCPKKTKQKTICPSEHKTTLSTYLPAEVYFMGCVHDGIASVGDRCAQLEVEEGSSPLHISI